MNAMVRNVPLAANDNASVPSGFSIATELTNTIAASGIRMKPIVRNWRFRYAHAPSWIASAISCIFGVPASAARTPLTR